MITQTESNHNISLCIAWYTTNKPQNRSIQYMLKEYEFHFRLCQFIHHLATINSYRSSMFFPMPSKASKLIEHQQIKNVVTREEKL